MDSKLKGFFDTAKATADTVTAAQAAAEKAATDRKTKLDADRAAHFALVHEEFAPIVDAINALPDKDGKHFAASFDDDTFFSTGVSSGVSISYDYPHQNSDYDGYSSHSFSTRPEVTVTVRREDDGKLRFTCAQYSMYEHHRNGDPTYKSSSPKDFDEARQELAVGLGTFAADRMAEIGAALGASDAASQDTAAPSSTAPDDPNNIAVFRKPLALRGAFANSQPAQEPQPAAKTAPASETPPPAAQSKPLWKRALGLN